MILFISSKHYLQSRVLIGQQQETRLEIKNDKNKPAENNRSSKRQEVFIILTVSERKEILICKNEDLLGQ